MLFIERGNYLWRKKRKVYLERKIKKVHAAVILRLKKYQKKKMKRKKKTLAIKIKDVDVAAANDFKFNYPEAMEVLLL